MPHGQNGAGAFSIPVEKLFEEAEETGFLILTGRKLSMFPPTASSFDLSDVTDVDLSANRFLTLPDAIKSMKSLEKLICYNNVLRSLPALIGLQSLVSLNISRNHLSQLPVHICKLSLKELNISHNRLVSLPDEIGELETLMDLDASGNELVALPETIGELHNLRDLNVRRNHLQALPEGLTSLRLVRLDFSVNRVSRLPLSFMKMTSLMTLLLHDNPMTSPPTDVCIRGRVHIFKFLKGEADQSHSKDDVSVRSSRAQQRRENRNRENSKKNSSLAQSHPKEGNIRSTHSQRATPLSLEEEMEALAGKHGFEWHRKVKAGKPVSAGGMVASSTTVSAGSTIAPKKGLSDGESEDDTPVSSPQPRSSTPVFDMDGSGDETDTLKAIRSAHKPVLPTKPSQEQVAAKMAGRQKPGCEQTHRSKNDHPHNSTDSISCENLDVPQLIRASSSLSNHMMEFEESPPERRRSFTVVRSERGAKEQQATMENLRKLLEAHLNTRLPENVLPAISDGVLLCNLVNSLRPHTIPVIYTPQRDTALSLLKSVKNVDSFITGSKKVGLERKNICNPADILERKNPLHIFITVTNLVNHCAEKHIFV